MRRAGGRPYGPGAARVVVLALGLAAACLPAAAQELPGLAPAEEPAPVPAPGSVAPESSPEKDAAIAGRLREIYREMAGLEDVRVSVSSGVVELTGETVSSAGREKAERVARQLQGVVEVENRVAEVRDVGRRLAPVLSALEERARDLVLRLPLFAVALLVFGLFVLLARALTAWDRPWRRIARNHFVRDLLRQAVRVVVVLAGAVVALEVVDATAVVAAVAGAAGLAGLALSFAFRDLAENYIASVLLALRQPFLPNDHVHIGEHEGRVVRLTSRATLLMDLEGNHVRIPNATVFKGVIVNYTRNPRRRFDFTVGVAPDTDLAAVQALGVETLSTVPGCLADPAPHAWIDTLGDSTVVVHFFGWLDQRRAEWAKVRGEAIRRVKEALDAAGVSLPEPTLRVLAAGAAPVAEPAPAPPAPAAAGPADVSVDRHLDREVAEDRAEQPDDLLDPSGPRE